MAESSNQTKILHITTDVPRGYSTEGHKRVILYCPECDSCTMIYASDTRTADT